MTTLPRECYNKPCLSLINGYGYCCSICGIKNEYKNGFESLNDNEKAGYCFWSGLPSAKGELSSCKESPMSNVCPLSSVFDTTESRTTMTDCSRITVKDDENCNKWFNEIRQNQKNDDFIDKNINNYCSLRRNQQFVEQSTNTNPQMTKGPYNDCLCWAAVNGYDQTYNDLVNVIGKDKMNNEYIACFWPPCMDDKTQLLPSSVKSKPGCTQICQNILDVIDSKKLDVNPFFYQHLQKCSNNGSTPSYVIYVILIILLLFVMLVIFIVYRDRKSLKTYWNE